MNIYEHFRLIVPSKLFPFTLAAANCNSHSAVNTSRAHFLIIMRKRIISLSITSLGKIMQAINAFIVDSTRGCGCGCSIKAVSDSKGNCGRRPSFDKLIEDLSFPRCITNTIHECSQRLYDLDKEIRECTIEKDDRKIWKRTTHIQVTKMDKIMHLKQTGRQIQIFHETFTCIAINFHFL